MVRKPGDRRYDNVLTIDQLVSLCEEMKGLSIKESLALGERYGVTRHNVESIRQMLGYSGYSVSYKLTTDHRNAIAREYAEGDMSMASLARKHGITYNAVRCLLKSRDVTIRNPMSYTRRQEMYIKTELKRGTPIKKIAFALGKKYKSVVHKIERMRRNNDVA